MGDTAVISYRSLGEASSEARQVSRKLTGYADSLQRSIVNRLDSYGGSDSGGVTQAKQRTEEKIEQLRDKAQAYTKYADDLSDLQKKCLSTDTAVRSSVSGLTASFKKANGINNNGIVNTINYMLTGLGNSTPAGRWLGNTIDTANSAKDYLKQRIKDWWGYEGGKQLVTGIVIAVLEVAIAIGTALTAGSMVVLIAAGILAIIAVFNGVANIGNEIRAYNETYNNADPALGRRYSAENTIQDTLRRESDKRIDHSIANGMDAISFVCQAVTVVAGLGELTKKAYKWATGSMADIKNLQIKNILTKDTMSAFTGKIKGCVQTGYTEIKAAVKTGDYSVIKTYATFAKDDFVNNLKTYAKGYNPLEVHDVESGVGFAEKWKFAVEILASDDTKGNVSKIFDKVVISNINAFKIVTYTPSNKAISGALAYKDSPVTIGNIKGNFSDVKDLYKSGKELVENILGLNSVVDTQIYEKLSQPCKVSIKIPEIYVPVSAMGGV